MPPQIVGTAESSVAFSASMKSTTLSGIRNGPGISIVAPERNELNGMPHALTWNIGTTTTMRSDSSAPVTVFASVAIACR